MADNEPILANAESHLIPSDHVDETLRILVGYPSSTRNERFDEVVILTDADAHFGSALSTLWGLVRGRLVPPTLLVGVGYPAERLSTEPAVRVRHLTPPSTEGDSLFVSFILDELMPWVSTTFDVSGSRTTYFGHSLGGLLGVHILLTRPSAFDRYLLSSPSLWWPGSEIARLEQVHADRHDDLPADVFLGVGGAETGQGGLSGVHDVAGDLATLVSCLRNRKYPSLRLATTTFPDEIHETAPQFTLSKGLRELLRIAP